MKFGNDIIELLEDKNAWYFAVDGRDHTDFWYKRQCGLLQRHLDNDRACKSTELNAFSDAKPLMEHKLSSSVLKTKELDISFNPAKILRENQPVLDMLQQLAPMEWRVVFRAGHTERMVFPKRGKEKKNLFTYFSLLIKLRLKNRREFIEIGEGSVRDLKFNQEGLSHRLHKVIENHRNSKAIEFREKMPVILNSGDGAIIFHELLGHALEADYIFRKESPITPLDIGKPIVSKEVNLVTRYGDDIFFKGLSGDDEGKSIKSSILVEKGVLRQLISDTYYKEKLNLSHSGHCRLEDFTKPPMPRMYALYVSPGKYHPEELMESTKYGVYADEFGDGKVYFHKNVFYFYIRNAHLVENGKLSRPLGSIMVQGNIFEVLNSVDMIANDFHFDRGISYCFKNGQTVNVRVGQPTVKIKNLSITPYYGHGVQF